MVMSAVSSVSTPGVLVTVMPRASAAWHVDIVDAVAEIGDQLQVRPGLGEERGVDLVGHGRHQHVGGLHRLDQLGRRQRLVVDVEPGVEELAHARLDHVRQAAGDDDDRSFLHRFRLPRGAPKPGGLHAALNHREAIGMATGAPHWRSPGGLLTGTLGRLTIRCEGTMRKTVLAVALLACARRPSAATAGAAGRAPRHGPAGAALRQPQDRPRQSARGALEGSSAPPGSSSAPACRSRSSPNSRPGAASAIRRAPRAGCCTRCCRGAAPPSSRLGRRAWRADAAPRAAGATAPIGGPAAAEGASPPSRTAAAIGAGWRSSDGAPTSTATSGRKSSGASIRTKRWSRDVDRRSVSEPAADPCDRARESSASWRRASSTTSSAPS